jgi:hypothetical protein
MRIRPAEDQVVLLVIGAVHLAVSVLFRLVRLNNIVNPQLTNYSLNSLKMTLTLTTP